MIKNGLKYNTASEETNIYILLKLKPQQLP